MQVIGVTQDTSRIRETFFKAIFGNEEGYVCVTYLIRGDKKIMHEEFFKYPEHLPGMLAFVNKYFMNYDIYFCPQLLARKERKKPVVQRCTVVWADLDECHPDNLEIEPSIVVESSEGRYQGYWRLKEPSTPLDAEDASHRIAYAYKDFGADIKGWDLSQLLRVPMTYNLKYPYEERPIVKVIKTSPKTYMIEDFKAYPEVAGYEFVDAPMPTVGMFDPDEVLAKYRNRLDPQVFALYQIEPREGSWSEPLWNLECLLSEAGMSAEEVFAVCQAAACNKFKRDGLTNIYLWKDVLRAYHRVTQRLEAMQAQGIDLTPLVTEEEKNRIKALPESFVDKYLAWARQRGDAAWQYHEAGAFVILSHLLSSVVTLPTSFGMMKLNLWFMILADTTITRKSTAMDMAMELLLEVDDDAVLATDGSLEGLLGAISTRPNRSGVFWRDEFSGLLEAMRKKDYLAGMVEALTKLYDGKYQKRILRKDTIEIRDPILIMLTGGIRSRILELLDVEHIISGFAPRFIFISAVSDVSKIRPVGPMTAIVDEGRQKLVAEMQQIKTHYDKDVILHVGEQNALTKKVWEAKLTPEAWKRYNDLEQSLVQAGIDSPSPEMYTPMFDRLAKSGLKMAVLLATARKQDNEIVVEETDVIRAITYIERWREFAVDVVSNAGKTVHEKRLDQVFRAVQKEPGVTRSRIMQNHHLDSRNAEFVLDTLEQRGLIRRVKEGKGERLFSAILS